MLLDIAAHMKSLARAIESIPLHLSVDIIRLDDALGESWGLPFQACQTWEVGQFGRCNALSTFWLTSRIRTVIYRYTKGGRLWKPATRLGLHHARSIPTDCCEDGSFAHSAVSVELNSQTRCPHKTGDGCFRASLFEECMPVSFLCWDIIEPSR